LLFSHKSWRLKRGCYWYVQLRRYSSIELIATIEQRVQVEAFLFLLQIANISNPRGWQKATNCTDTHQIATKRRGSPFSRRTDGFQSKTVPMANWRGLVVLRALMWRFSFKTKEIPHVLR
jgi:hypothetical protein